MKKQAERMESIKPFHVMALLEKARQLEEKGKDIIHLEVGEPDFTTPAPVINAGIAALQQGNTRYTPATGLPELRHAIADYYQVKFGITLSAKRVVVTSGASGAISLLTSLLFNPGDEVLLSDPGYPCNDHFLLALGAVPRRISVSADSRYQLNAALVAKHWNKKKTAAAWIASPSNPTGTTLTLSEWADIKSVVSEQGGVLLADEIYQNLVYDAEPVTALSLADPDDSIFVINSFSKYFNMTGWRLGWLVAPECYIEGIDRLAQNFFLAAPTVAQYAALEAFSDTSLALYEERRQLLSQRRDFLLQRLPEIGFRVLSRPDGAFYIYCDVSDVTSDSHAFCLSLLESTGVALTPGIDFGVNESERFVRIAYTADLDRLAEALKRIQHFLNRTTKTV